jgi:hypothetical protein
MIIHEAISLQLADIWGIMGKHHSITGFDDWYLKGHVVV